MVTSMIEPPQRARGGPLLFAAAIFASAFLIFLVQPMVGKRILPWFGGAPAVWTLCLAFYQTTLFLGYAYAHCVIRYVPPRQLPSMRCCSAGALRAAILPSEAWTPAGGTEPTRAILAMLGFHVALPFLALAATGPLVQAWFARRYPRRSPYPLYAVSNAGSLVAMLSYPFLLEPACRRPPRGSCGPSHLPRRGGCSSARAWPGVPRSGGTVRSHQWTVESAAAGGGARGSGSCSPRAPSIC
jgi:hypothetical protein